MAMCALRSDGLPVKKSHVAFKSLIDAVGGGGLLLTALRGQTSCMLCPMLCPMTHDSDVVNCRSEIVGNYVIPLQLVDRLRHGLESLTRSKGLPLSRMTDLLPPRATST